MTHQPAARSPLPAPSRQVKPGTAMGMAGPQNASLASLQTQADESAPVAQLQDLANLQRQADTAPPPRPNNTGLPNDLKAGIESLSGMSMDHVRVHRNSDKPATVQAHAYAQGSDIHLGPGQEKHLPHEAWHVVQQAQGRVRPTMQLQRVAINDDPGLEAEADAMGARAAAWSGQIGIHDRLADTTPATSGAAVQRKVIVRIRTTRASDELGRLISEIRIEGRAPTDAGPDSKGNYPQGDHTVAETLINESAIREVMNFRPKVALNNLTVLGHLTLPEDAATKLSDAFYKKYFGTIDDMEGEDQNTIIEDCMQKYIELANKREGTAFLKEKEMTHSLKGERSAIGLVRKLADKLAQDKKPSSSDLQDAANSIVALIDLKYSDDQYERYLNTILRALDHALLSVLPTLDPGDAGQIVYLMMFKLKTRDKMSVMKLNDIFRAVISHYNLPDVRDL